jgi:hypothetical protein
MEARILQNCFGLGLCRVLRASVARALGLYHDSILNVKCEATGERSRVADELDLGALIPLTGEVMLRFVPCDRGGESDIEVSVDHVEALRRRRWLDTNGLTVEAVSPSGGEEPTESTLISLRRRVASSLR